MSLRSSLVSCGWFVNYEDQNEARNALVHHSGKVFKAEILDICVVRAGIVRLGPELWVQLRTRREATAVTHVLIPIANRKWSVESNINSSKSRYLLLGDENLGNIGLECRKRSRRVWTHRERDT